MKYLEKLEKYKELALLWDKSVNELCEVFPNAFEGDLVVSAEKIMDAYVKECFGESSVFVDIVYDWRFEHEFGSKNPMVFYIDDEETLARNNEDLAKILSDLSALEG